MTNSASTGFLVSKKPGDLGTLLHILVSFPHRRINILKGPRSSSYWLPRNLSNHIDRQARTWTAKHFRHRNGSGCFWVPVSRIRIRQYLYLSGSGSGPDLDPCNKQKVRKPQFLLIFLLLFVFLSLKTDVNVPSKSVKRKNFEKSLFFVGYFLATDKKAGSG
jgi:hypothetical protein